MAFQIACLFAWHTVRIDFYKMNNLFFCRAHWWAIFILFFRYLIIWALSEIAQHTAHTWRGLSALITQQKLGFKWREMSNSVLIAEGGASLPLSIALRAIQLSASSWESLCISVQPQVLSCRYFDGWNLCSYSSVPTIRDCIYIYIFGP